MQSYIRPVLQTGSLPALMEFARKALISLKSSKDLGLFRFAFPRSDLFRHQSFVYLRNQLAIHTSFTLNFVCYAVLAA